MTTTNSPSPTTRSMSWSATTSRSVDSPQTLVTPRHSSAVTAAMSSELGSPTPPQHPALDQAERRVEQIADEADHRHAEEGEIHVHHRPAHHHDGAEPSVDPDHLGSQHPHPGAEEVHSDEVEEGRDGGREDDVAHDLPAAGPEDPRRFDVHRVDVGHRLHGGEGQREVDADEDHEDRGPVADAEGDDSELYPGNRRDRREQRDGLQRGLADDRE